MNVVQLNVQQKNVVLLCNRILIKLNLKQKSDRHMNTFYKIVLIMLLTCVKGNKIPPFTLSKIMFWNVKRNRIKSEKGKIRLIIYFF